MFPLWFPLDAFFELFECEFKIFYDYIFINNIYSTNSIEPPNVCRVNSLSVVIKLLKYLMSLTQLNM